MVTGFRSDNPDAVVFVALYDLPEGATLYMTDNAWTGEFHVCYFECVLSAIIPLNDIA